MVVDFRVPLGLSDDEQRSRELLYLSLDVVEGRRANNRKADQEHVCLWV